MTENEWAIFSSQADLARYGLNQTADWFAGTPAGEWHVAFQLDPIDAVHGVAAVLGLVTPEWKEKRPGDLIPLRAIEAAVQYADCPDNDLKLHVSTLAKGCKTSRKDSLGFEHRFAEAARAFAYAAIAEDNQQVMLGLAEALAKIEEHVIYKYSVNAEYGKEHETRRRMLVSFVHQIQSQSA